MERIIIDCDNTLGVPGRPIDDGQTILYILGRPDIELIGITTSFGNSNIEDVYWATSELVQRHSRPDIPVLKGPGSRGQVPTEAAHFLAEQAAHYSGEINLVALGPMGNLKCAADLDPKFFQNLKQITCMGGYHGPLLVPGWEEVHEVNFSGDPEAAFAMLHASCPVTVMNAQVCLDAPFGLSELARQGKHDPKLHKILYDYLIHSGSTPQGTTDYLWDLLPAVYVSYPELFDQNLVWLVSTVDDLKDGMLVLGEFGQGAQLNMPTQILDVNRFYDILFQAWATAPIRQ
jgi:inosine-uridine nucleoside N-ribohydrolase